MTGYSMTLLGHLNSYIKTLYKQRLSSERLPSSVRAPQWLSRPEARFELPLPILFMCHANDT